MAHFETQKSCLANTSITKTKNLNVFSPLIPGILTYKTGATVYVHLSRLCLQIHLMRIQWEAEDDACHFFYKRKNKNKNKTQ